MPTSSRAGAPTPLRRRRRATPRATITRGGVVKPGPKATTRDAAAWRLAPINSTAPSRGSGSRDTSAAWRQDFRLHEAEIRMRATLMETGDDRHDRDRPFGAGRMARRNAARAASGGRGTLSCTHMINRMTHAVRPGSEGLGSYVAHEVELAMLSGINKPTGAMLRPCLPHLSRVIEHCAAQGQRTAYGLTLKPGEIFIAAANRR